MPLVSTIVLKAVVPSMNTTLPVGTWSSELVASFFHGERITYAVLAVLVGLIATAGALTLTDSHATEEPDAEEVPGIVRRLRRRRAPEPAPARSSPPVPTG